MTRRARPTLRVLRVDLSRGWESTHPKRQLDRGDLDSLSPLSELPHPLIRKASESFGDIPSQDNFVGRIASSPNIPLYEVKIGQWRGGIWIDPNTDNCWLVVAGLAKGNHKDRDDFYKQVERAETNNELVGWLPTDEDRHVLKRERASVTLADWELDIQRSVLLGLEQITSGGSTNLGVHVPGVNSQDLAQFTLTVAHVHEPDYGAEEFVLEVVVSDGFVGSHLAWQATLRILITVCPPENGWDRYGDSYSTISEIGFLRKRIEELQALTARGELAESIPNDKSHFAHVKSLADSMIEGLGVRSLCGIYFVPTQDHESLPKCTTCAERYQALQK